MFGGTVNVFQSWIDRTDDIRQAELGKCCCKKAQLKFENEALLKRLSK